MLTGKGKPDWLEREAPGGPGSRAAGGQMIPASLGFSLWPARKEDSQPGDRRRRFVLMVDSGSADEPRPRRFGSLAAALAAADETDAKWRPFLWVIEETDGANVVHVCDGKLA